MSLPDPRSIYGIHSVTFYDRSTMLPYGPMLRVLGQANLSQSQELVDLLGGSSFDAWATERAARTSEMSVTFREYPSWLYKLLLGAEATDNAAEASGNVSTAENANGTSVIDASTGIATVAALPGSEANLKFGCRYVIKAVSATTVDVYAQTDLDFSQGTDAVFVDSSMKINAAPLSITTGADTDITDFGLRLTGGAGTIAFTTDDTAIFDVRPVNEGSTEVTVGSRLERFCDFGVIVAAQRQASGQMSMIDCFKVTAGGLPHNFTEKAFSEGEVTLKLSYDANRDGLYKIKHVKSVASCI